MSTGDGSLPPPLTVVVPVWNEKPWLNLLLTSVLTDPNVAEVIVADNESLDGSGEFARTLGARVVQGGRPAVGRNAGAGAAESDLVAFIDADAVVPPHALRRVRDWFSDERVVAVHFRLRPATRSRYVRAAFGLMDLYFAALASMGMAQGLGSFVAVRSSAFSRVGGFNERLKVGEDADLLRRLRHQGRVTYDRRTVIGVSARRFRLENPIWFSIKVLVWSLLRLFGLSSSVFPYRWEQYPGEIAQEDVRLLSDLSREMGHS